MADIPKIDIGKGIALYVKLRDEIEAIKEKHKAELKPHVTKLEQLNTILLDYLNKTGLDSARAENGTVYRSEKKSATIADQAEFRRYVIGNEMWDIVDWRANAPAVAAFIEENESPPPGVSFSIRTVAGVQRS